MADATVMTVGAMVAAAKGRVRNLSVEEVARELERGEALLVDLRDKDERSQNGALPGALHVPRGMLEFRADGSSPYHLEEFRRERPIILYCASGGRSALGAETLMRMGYREVAHLDGGLKAWKEQGRQVEAVEGAR